MCQHTLWHHTAAVHLAAVAKREAGGAAGWRGGGVARAEAPQTRSQYADRSRDNRCKPSKQCIRSPRLHHRNRRPRSSGTN